MMSLQQISYALRAAGDVARAGENLLSSLERSRRVGMVPMLFGVALGVGIGALVFHKELRDRVLEWVGVTVTASRTTNGVAQDPRVTVDAPRA